jgi:hypothetical protein
LQADFGRVVKKNLALLHRNRYIIHVKMWREISPESRNLAASIAVNLRFRVGFVMWMEVPTMPRGPNGERRPADTIGAAVMVGKIATGEIADDIKPLSGRVRSGKAGGKARSAKLGASERTAIAQNAAVARWKGGLKMNVHTEQQKLVARFQAMKENGLKDLKFFFGQVSESTTDAFCEEVNRLYRLVEEGRFTDVADWGDGKRLLA